MPLPMVDPQTQDTVRLEPIVNGLKISLTIESIHLKINHLKISMPFNIQYENTQRPLKNKKNVFVLKDGKMSPFAADIITTCFL